MHILTKSQLLKVLVSINKWSIEVFWKWFFSLYYDNSSELDKTVNRKWQQN